jgi:hypothetical protein
MTLRKWAAGIAAFILLATLVAQASATTYYVNASRQIQSERYPATAAAYNELLRIRDTRAGTSSATCWGTVTKANETVKSGDVVILEDNIGGSYMAQPSPVCQDTVGEHTPGGVPANPWVTYIGNLAQPYKVSCFGYVLFRPYVSIKGIHFISPGSMLFSGKRDSVQLCEFSGPIDWSLTDYSYYGENHFNGYRFTSNKSQYAAIPPYEPAVPGPHTRGNEFNSNHFTRLFNESGGSSNCLQMIGVDSCRFLFNTFDINGAGAASPSSYFFAVKYSSYVSFRGCRWNFSNALYDGDGEGYAVGLIFRDKVSYVSMNRDTMISADGRRMKMEISASGNWPDTMSVTNTSIDSCYFDMGDWMWAQHNLVSSSITNNTIINRRGSAFVMDKDALSGKNYITGNTFIGNVEGGEVGLNVVPSPVFRMVPQSVGDTLTVENNIFYSLYSPSGPGRFPYTQARYAAVEYKPSVFDTTYWNGWDRNGGWSAGLTHNNLLKSDHNLYSYYGAAPMSSYEDSIGKRSITFVDPDWNQIFTWPGMSADGHDHGPAYTADSINLVAGSFADSVIIHFHPTLADTTFTAYVGRRVVTPPTSGKVAVTLLEGPPPRTRSGQWARWCPSCDDSSTYGSPLFADSTFSEIKHPVLTRYSLARHLGTDSTDVGSAVYTSPPLVAYNSGLMNFEAYPESEDDSSSFWVRNDGESDSLRVTGVVLVNPLDGARGDFTFSATTSATGPGKSTEFKVYFSPHEVEVPVGNYVDYTYEGAHISVATNDPGNPTFTIPISVSSWRAK